jgi:hypothetical protein
MLTTGSISTHSSRTKGKRSFVPQDNKEEKEIVTLKNNKKPVTFVTF